MARHARKRIHYVRATYGPGMHPANSYFETVTRHSLRQLPNMGDTEIPVSGLGILATRHRNAPPRTMRLAIGAGAPGEAMSTMGLQIARQDDADIANPPPRDRAFKIADAFCLLDRDEVLVLVDGMRIGSVESYLRLLIERTNQPAGHSAFEFRPVSNTTRQELLEDEGVRELRMSGTAYAASQLLGEEGASLGDGVIRGMWDTFKSNVRALFEQEVHSPQERDTLANHWSDLNIVATIKARGGSRAEPIVLQSLQGVGMDMIEDSPAGLDIQIVTRQGSRVSPSELVLGKYVNLTRQNDRNDLSTDDVWSALNEYRLELRQQGRWGQ